MTLLYMDGFEHLDLASRGWAVSGSPTFVTGVNTRFGYGAAVSVPLGTGAIKRAFTPSTKIIMGVARKVPSTGTINGNGIGFWTDGGTNLQISFKRINGTNGYGLYRGGNLLATSSAVFTENWHYIEIMCTISDTTGRFLVHVDGAVAMDFTGDTRNVNTALLIDAITLSTEFSNTPAVHDDLYILDDLGSVNNDFLGDKRILTLAPNGPGSTTQLTPTGSANNWDNVNEFPVSATDYNASAVIGTRDLYALEDLPAGVQQIAGVYAHALGIKSDAGNINMKSVVTSGTSTTVGPAVAMATGLTDAPAMFEKDPNTNVAWTSAAINALQIGAEVA